MLPLLLIIFIAQLPLMKYSILKKAILVSIGIACSVDAVNSQSIVKPAVNDLLQPIALAKLSGFVGARLDAAYQNRIMTQDASHLVQPFLNRNEASCWQTEFWGKWFTSAVLAYRYKPTPALKATLDKTVADLIATQSADGYIGNYAPDKHLQQWDIWGRKYCMLGLISYYDLTQNKPALNAAAKEADYLI